MAVRTARKVFRSLFLPKTSSRNATVGDFDPHKCVIVRQPAVATTVPSVSPFPLKLETYLRLANISYKNRFGGLFSSKGKIPWIQYKDDAVADSNFCIEYLNDKFSVDLDAELSKGQRGVSNSFLKMIEENTYWTVVYYRWIENPHTTVNFLFPTASAFKKRMIAHVAGNRVKKTLYCHGIGRHTRDEIYSIASRDLESISALLESKPFLMGDRPSVVDTAAFGLLANLVWHDVESPQSCLIRNELHNIEAYCQRMKEHTWPDWDEEVRKRKEIAFKKK